MVCWMMYVEALFSVNSEQPRFVPEEKEGEVAANLVIYDQDRDTGLELSIDCTRFGSGACSISISVEYLRFESNAKFVLAIENGRYVSAIGQTQLLADG